MRFTFLLIFLSFACAQEKERSQSGSSPRPVIISDLETDSPGENGTNQSKANHEQNPEVKKVEIASNTKPSNDSEDLPGYYLYCSDAGLFNAEPMKCAVAEEGTTNKLDQENDDWQWTITDIPLVGVDFVVEEIPQDPQYHVQLTPQGILPDVLERILAQTRINLDIRSSSRLEEKQYSKTLQEAISSALASP